MSPAAAWRGLLARVTITPAVAAVLAFALIVAGLALALYSESMANVERGRQAEVQTQILATSVAAPLAFDDDVAAREYVDALKANRDIEAAGAYDLNGHLAAGFVRRGAPLPARNTLAASRVVGGALLVTQPVVQDGARLGSVFLRVAADSVARRASRYVGIGLLLLMASVLVAGLGAAFASANDANRRLQEEIRSREQAEEALRQAQKMEAMGQLTGGVAHDFNNLLMAASSGLDLLERTADPARQEKLKAGIRQAIDRGAGLTHQLLAFARRTPVHPEVIDPGERLRAMRGLIEHSLREDIVTCIQLEPDLWPIEVDASQFEVALLNVAVNARDAMPSGGVLAIDIRNRPGQGDGARDMVRLSIRDTGVGMAPDVAARVFEPFFTTKGVGQGTGLGLSQVYGFARSSGGVVEVDSEVGVGTEVSICIPRSAKALPIAQVPEAPAAPSPSASRARVLLVEDDEQVANLVGAMLNELGYDCDRAATAAAALDRLAAADPPHDLVFSDMVMPGEMGGLDLARLVAARRPGVPVVLTTGYSAAAAAAAADGIRLLVKPYRIEALAAELRAALADDPPRAR